MDWKKKEIKKCNAHAYWFLARGDLKEIYVSRAHSTFASFATLASLQPKLKQQTFNSCSRPLILIWLSSTWPLKNLTCLQRVVILLFSEVIAGSWGGNGSLSSSKIAHDFKTGDLLAFLILRGLDDEAVVCFEIDFWIGIAGPFPFLGLRMSPFPHPPSGFCMPTTV